MKSKIKNKDECLKIFQIEIPYEHVKKTAEEVYRSIRKIAKIPGFRPGTVPQDLLEKHYSNDAREETLKRLIPEGYEKALDDHKVAPIGFPRIHNIGFEIGKPLTFEAHVDVKPNVKLKNYKGIKVDKKRISVSAEEVSEAVSRLQNMHSRYSDVIRPVKKDDYAVCDVEAFIDGKPITKKNKNMWIMADKEASLLGLGEHLIGLEKGQSKEIDTVLPENYPDKKYAGKSARFNVTLNEVKEKSLPELNDSFAKTLNMESMDLLKTEIESQLFSRKENNLKIGMKNEIIERLLKDNKFLVPESIVARQKEVFIKRLESELIEKGIKKEDADKKIKELDSKITEDARDKVRLYFILDAIAEKEKVGVREEDVNASLKAIADSAGQKPEDVRNYYEKENLLDGLKEEIKEDKALEFLLKEADIVEDK